jgi:hypothetical protein
MTQKNMARPFGKGAGRKNFDADNSTRSDPLTGWFSLAKYARLNRKQKRGWNRKGGRHV